jgi:septal ring factor EnvC (AmiA/AmiB activator)
LALNLSVFQGVFSSVGVRTAGTGIVTATQFELRAAADRSFSIRVFSPQTAEAKTGPGNDATGGSNNGTLKTQSTNIDREIKKRQAEVLSFTRREARLVENLHEIDMSIDQRRKQIAAFRLEMKQIDADIKQNLQASRALKKEIAASERYVSQRLVAMYKLNWLGKIHILASSESMFDFFQRKAGLEKILQYDEAMRNQMMSNRQQLEDVLTALNMKKQEKKAIETDYQGQLKVMSREKRQKQKLLADIRNQKSMELAAIDSLQKAARALDLKIDTLHIEKKKPSKAVKPMERQFVKLKGLLIMPVKGKVIKHFGRFTNTRFNIANFRSGIDIQADRGEPIHAVSGGRILYASWFKGYGNMVIIDHGAHYYTVYAHIEEVFKTKGERVDAQEVIATVGDSGSLEGPGLYFEVRHRGKPLDPMDWIKKG